MHVACIKASVIYNMYTIFYTHSYTHTRNLQPLPPPHIHLHTHYNVSEKQDTLQLPPSQTFPV